MEIVQLAPARSRINLVAEFMIKIQEAISLVPQMGTVETLDAVQYWNEFSQRLQEVVYRIFEFAEIQAIALDMEQTNTDNNPDYTSNDKNNNENITGDNVDCKTAHIEIDSTEIISSTVIPDGINIDQSTDQSLLISDLQEVVIPYLPDNTLILTVSKDETAVNNDVNEHNGVTAKPNGNQQQIEGNVELRMTDLQDSSYECYEVGCAAKFRTKRNLRRHVRSHSGHKPWECLVCLARFTERKSLKVHMRKHTGERPFQCSICSKSFSQSGILQGHLAMHMDVRAFRCDQCGHAFRQKSQLKLHMQRHAGLRKYSCQHCSVKFLTKCDLKRHKRVHTGERPFRCNLCGKSYTRKQSLIEHTNRHYGQKPYSCKHCSKTFAEMSGCYKHMKSHGTVVTHQEKLRLTEVPSSHGD